MTLPRPRRKPVVLAFFFNARGIAHAVFDGPRSLLRWGVKTANPKSVENRCEKALALVLLFRPSVIVVQDCDGELSRCTKSVRETIEQLATHAHERKIEIARYSRSDVLSAFAPHRAHTKHQIALAIAEILPELAPHIPPKRKQWQGEAHRMAFFDAASLALTYYADERR